MRRGDMDDLAAFVAVANHLSFRGAAGELGVTPSALSHALRQLETRLGVRLLNRTTRSVALTDAGQRLLDRLRPAVEQVARALDDLKGEQARPFGRLRLYATHLAGAAVVAPVWARFLAGYPDVHLEVFIDEAPIDIVARGFDAGIGPQDRAAADMVQVRVSGPMRVAFVGAPAYFARRPPPRTPEDLAAHLCVEYLRASDAAPIDWPVSRDGTTRRVPVAGRVVVNNPDLAIRAALDGLGIALALEALAEPLLRSGQLVRVLDDWSPSFEGLFLYYPGHRQVPAALRAFIDLVQATRRTSGPSISIDNPFTSGNAGP